MQFHGKICLKQFFITNMADSSSPTSAPIHASLLHNQQQ